MTLLQGMTLLDLAGAAPPCREQAARLLHEAFNHPIGWPSLEAARREVATVLAQGFALAAVESGSNLVLGWIGGLPEYDGRVWELHPLVVHPEHRRRGIGRELVTAFEAEARARGGWTATLGTDDDAGITSLADRDLYDDIPRHIADLRAPAWEHPFLFYRRLGYVVTGVMPDANGRGRPDIYLSKPLRR
jgi:aminoglycoside 6'-N-acetyltransferase I